jgi:uncharacterized protein (TIGR03067 family)
MNRYLCAFMTVAVVSVLTVHAGDDKKGATPLEGEWTALTWRRGDAEIGKDKVATELVVKKDTYEYPTGINKISKKGTFKVDEKKGTIDFTPDDGPAKGKTLLGIYKVDGDMLTLCFTVAGMARPTELKSGERTTVLATYQRKKK